MVAGTSGSAMANHQVFIEGETDFDGDGVVGLAEDADGDFFFGTFAGALGPGTGLNQNGRAVVVTSGRFAEVVNITGQVTIEGAPGVEADIEAFLAGADPRLREFDTPMRNNTTRANAPGIIVNAPANRRVVIRNISTRNWTDGIRVQGQSRVLIDNVRIEHNINFGINVLDNAQISVFNTSVHSSGFRVNPVSGDFPTVLAPNTGAGILFSATARGSIFGSSITGNFGGGILLTRSGGSRQADLARVQVQMTQQFDNRSEIVPTGPAMPAPAPTLSVN
jgi:hypothetical protein